MAIGQERTVLGKDPYNVSLGRFAHNLGDGTGKNPWMETAQRLLPTFLQVYFCHFVRF